VGDMADDAIGDVLDSGEEFEALDDLEREYRMATTKKVRRKKSTTIITPKGETSNGRVRIPGPNEYNEPPEHFTNYCTIIFGEKGVGKTSLCAQFPGSLVLMTEPRRRNLRIRQAVVPPMSMDQLMREYKEAEKKGIDYQTPWMKMHDMIQLAVKDDSVKTIVIDTIDRAYEHCLMHQCVIRDIKDPSALNDYGATWRSIKDDLEEMLRFVLNTDKGLIMVSHADLRQVEARSGETYEILCPTCTPSCFKVLKAFCDYAFYYGYHSKQRALFLRGNELIWSSCGVDDHFLSPKGVPLNTIRMGDSAKEAYESLMAAFANKVEDLEPSS